MVALKTLFSVWPRSYVGGCSQRGEVKWRHDDTPLLRLRIPRSLILQRKKTTNDTESTDKTNNAASGIRAIRVIPGPNTSISLRPHPGPLPEGEGGDLKQLSDRAGAFGQADDFAGHVGLEPQAADVEQSVHHGRK